MRDLIFAGRRRAQVLSADRIGILASGSVTMAFEVQTKLAVGNLQASEVRMEDLVDQGTSPGAWHEPIKNQAIDLAGHHATADLPSQGQWRNGQDCQPIKSGLNLLIRGRQ